MLAPTIADLLAGDIAIEEVWRDILNAAGLRAAIAFSDLTKTTPYAEIEFEEIAATEHTFSYTVPGSNPARIVKYNTVAIGSLVTRFCTTRGTNSQSQKSMVGKGRACAGDFAALFNTDVLPWHGINLFKEIGLKRYIDPDDRLDKTELRHRVHFNVRPDAWALIA
jgi:hypothetical protein